jgi:hypothetical protein
MTFKFEKARVGVSKIPVCTEVLRGAAPLKKLVVVRSSDSQVLSPAHVTHDRKLAFPNCTSALMPSMCSRTPE